MSWFSNRAPGARSSDQTTPALKQKHKQIESLRDQFGSVIELRRDELYRLTIQVERNNLTLDISLPPRFPLIGPVVTVFPPVRHPWVNEQMIVDGSPLVKNFTTHSNLGRVIQQVVKEFNDHPPYLLHSQSVPVNMAHHPMPLPHSHASSGPPMSTTSIPVNPAYFSQPPASGGIQQNGAFSPPYHHNQVPPAATGASTALSSSPDSRFSRRPAPPPPRVAKNSVAAKTYQPPPIPDKFEDIRNMSTEELERYIGEAEGLVLVEKYVSDLDLTRKLQKDRNELFHENETQASNNLAYEPELEDMWTELQDKCLQIEGLKSEHEKKLSKQRQLLERYDIRGVTSRMKTLAQESETQSEIIAEDFLDNKMSVKEFVQGYKQERVLHHLRKIKHENLSYGSRR